MSGVGKVRNGERLSVVFGPYSGEAGICDRPDGTTDVAFFHDHRAMRDVKEGTIDGAPCTVIEVERAGKGRRQGRIPGMVVLTVKRDT